MGKAKLRGGALGLEASENNYDRDIDFEAGVAHDRTSEWSVTIWINEDSDPPALIAAHLPKEIFEEILQAHLANQESELQFEFKSKSLKVTGIMHDDPFKSLMPTEAIQKQVFLLRRIGKGGLSFGKIQNLAFAVTPGYRLGIRNHMFRAETKREIKQRVFEESVLKFLPPKFKGELVFAGALAGFLLGWLLHRF
jgi:hypothetical protein